MRSSTGLILLAAGNSKRMGQCKFFLKMKNGVTFFENIISSFHEFGIKQIIVVTQKDKVAQLNQLCSLMIDKPVFVINHYPEYEKFYSLQLGIEELVDVDHCFIHNADTPFIERLTLEALIKNKSEANFICPVNNGKGGHPILIDKVTLKELATCPKESVLRDELKLKKRLNVVVEDELVTVDIDTPEEYQKYFS